jgi:hypothetical protein
MPVARPDEDMQPPPVVAVAPSCRCRQRRHPRSAVALSRWRGTVPHDLKEMEEQHRELGKWMTLMATTTATAGDCDRGMMASEFGRTPTLSSLSWTRTGGGGGGGTRRGSNNDDHCIDDRPPPRMLVGVPMPVVRYRTNLDFPGINLSPLAAGCARGPSQAVRRRLVLQVQIAGCHDGPGAVGGLV